MRGVEHLRDRRDELDRPVVDQLGEPPALVALGAEPLGERPAVGVVASIDHRVTQRDRDRLRARVGLELREDVAHVALDRLLRDEQLRRDVGVRHAVGEELQDLALARGEHVAAVARLSSSADISAGSTNVSPAATFSIARSSVSCGASLRM